MQSRLKFGLHYAFPFLTGLTWLPVASLPLLLIPYTFKRGNRLIQTDSLSLFKKPWISDEQIAKQIAKGRQVLEARTKHRGELDLTTIDLAHALKRLRASPDHELALSTAAEFLRLKHDPQGLECFRKLLSLFPNSPFSTRYLDRYLGYCSETDRVRDNPDDLDALSLKLEQLRPGDISAIATRACILVDLGQLELAVPILKRAIEQAEDIREKAYYLVFLALAEKQLGNCDQARNSAEQAAKLNPKCIAIRRVSDLLPPDSEAKVPK